MPNTKHESLRRVFDLALAAAPAERAAVLDRECPGDAALRARVEGMLAAAESDDRFLRDPSGDGSHAATLRQGPLEAPGTRIGPYKILQLIGEGGFGSVYMAEQQQPVQRRVALKIIKLGMDTRAVIARFEAERQALAMMDHPNIARVLDAGATDAGRPYFVMELVKGEPITRYCDKNSLAIGERLQLFSQACLAVQHAHQKGVIHRDIKPSNILVSTQDGKPFAKVIDFGIAKATASRLTEKTLFTEHRQLIGTPEYMSPEQAEGSLDIDTRTDVYSLGVLLYELLTGSTPFDSAKLRSAAFAEIQRIIREVEPPRPSTRLSQSGELLASVAAQRHTEPRRLGTIVRGELDWIVMKALEKDRSRRYETADGLAMDIQRFLGGDAVVAAPPSRVYRFRKFARRNKAAVAGGAAVLTALIVGLAGTLWQAREAARERDAARAAGQRQAQLRKEADAALKQAETINAFVTAALRSSDPTRGGRQDITIAQAMERSLTEIDAGAFEDQPETEAHMRRVIGEILLDNGREVQAEPLFQQALEIRQRLFSGDQPLVAQSLSDMAHIKIVLGRSAEAESFARQALDMRQRLFTGDHPDVASSLDNLATVLQELGDAAAAEPLFEQALDMRRRLYPGDHQDVAVSLTSLASVRDALGRVVDAEPLFQQALDMSRRLHPGDHPLVAQNLNNLAYARKALGRAGDAEPLYRQALEMAQQLYIGDHGNVAMALNNLASTHMALGRAAEAEPLYQQALDMVQRLYPGDHPDVARSMSSLARVRQTLGRAADAEPLFVQALEMRRRLFPGDHPEVAASLNNLALLLQTMGRTAESETLQQQSLEMYQRIHPSTHPDVARGLNNLALMRQSLGRFDEAESLYQQSLDMIQSLLPGDHPYVAATMNNLASAKRMLGRPAEALPLFEESLRMYQRLYEGDHPDVADGLTNLAECRMDLGMLDEAEREARAGAAMFERLFPDGHPYRALAMSMLAMVLHKQERNDEARAMIDQAVDMILKFEPESAPTAKRVLNGRTIIVGE